MATLTVQDTKDGLLDVVFSNAAAGGDVVAAGTRAGGWSLGVLLLVNNGTAGNRVVTVGGVEYTIAAGDIGAFPVRSIYHGSPVAITYDAVTTTTVAAVRV